MNIDGIKTKEKYNLELICRVIEMDANSNVVCATFELPTGRLIDIRPGDFEALSPITPYTPLNLPIMTKIPEEYPKYTPCRLFKKGDKVKAVLRHGRIPNDDVPKDVILEVFEDERFGFVKVLHKMGAFLQTFKVCALYLELVTPVEELEPYSVAHIAEYWSVRKKDDCGSYSTVSWFSEIDHPHAKEAAEAECERLNEEHRKEKA